MNVLQNHIRQLKPTRRKAMLKYCARQRITKKEVTQAITQGQHTARVRVVLSWATGIPENKLFDPHTEPQLTINF